jgi:hypothetical protein
MFLVDPRAGTALAAPFVGRISKQPGAHPADKA